MIKYRVCKQFLPFCGLQFYSVDAEKFLILL